MKQKMWALLELFIGRKALKYLGSKLGFEVCHVTVLHCSLTSLRKIGDTLQGMNIQAGDTVTFRFDAGNKLTIMIDNQEGQ